MAMYEIIEWNERYEVDSHNHAWEPGHAFRKGPLEYVRAKVHGRALGEGYRRLIEAAGEDKALSIFGLYSKLVEIAADEKHGRRNCLSSPEDTAFLLHAPVDQVRFGYKVMMQLGWIREIPGDSRQLPEIPGNSGKVPEIPLNINQYKQTIDIEERVGSDWVLTKQLIESRFPGNLGILTAIQWIGTVRIAIMPPGDALIEMQRLKLRLQEADLPRKGKPIKDAAAWFMGCLVKEFGYVPKAERGDGMNTVRFSDVAGA